MTPDPITVLLTAEDLASLQDMLQSYREAQEDIHANFGWDGTPETLFTPTQRKLFSQFDVVSINHN
jgi:hypothetical protein